MRKLACILLFAVAAMYAQSPDTSFVLDGTKPYVYLQFDHVGPRKPLHEGEPSTGLWLRIVNNCKVPIGVRSYGVTTGDIGTGVFDEIIPVQQGITVQAYFGEISLSTDEKPTQTTANEQSTKMPEGYSAELSSVTRVLPGQSLLFSVPRNHVSRDWFLRVKFALAVSKPSVGPGPFTELDFFNEQIPALLGKADPKDTLLHESGHVDPPKPQ
jgi:hypothetical protein